MKSTLFITTLLALQSLIGGALTAQTLAYTATTHEETTTEGKVVYINEEGFNSKVLDVSTYDGSWKYLGTQPCIVDFYADWCGPCRMIAPALTELAKEYAGRITIYKVNVDQNRNLSQFMGASSIPMLLFCPMQGAPALQQGANTKEGYTKIIEEFLLGNKPADGNNTESVNKN